MKRAKKQIADWKRCQPTETRWGVVKSLLKRLGFDIQEKRGSEVLITHPRLAGKDPKRFGDIGGFTIHLGHPKIIVKWYDLRDLIEALDCVIEVLEHDSQTDEDEIGEA